MKKLMDWIELLGLSLSGACGFHVKSFGFFLLFYLRYFMSSIMCLLVFYYFREINFRSTIVWWLCKPKDFNKYYEKDSEMLDCLWQVYCTLVITSLKYNSTGFSSITLKLGWQEKNPPIHLFLCIFVEVV